MSFADVELHRSYLYAPGSAPEVMRKALVAGADAVVLDLEDAVAPQRKGEARAEVGALLRELASGDGQVSGSAVHVRINRSGDGYLEDDLEAVVLPALGAIRLPKAESPAAIASVAARLDELERARGIRPGRIRLYPTVESALGAVSIAELATSPRVARFAIGTADLLADIFAAGDDDLATLHVRSELVLRSRVAGIGPPVDSVFTDLEDLDGLRRQAGRARALGFQGKSIIHPRQLPAVHEVFTPSTEELNRAERIVAALEREDRGGSGVVSLDGSLVDAAVVARALATLALRRDT